MTLKKILFLSAGFLIFSNMANAYSYDEERMLETRKKAYQGNEYAMLDLAKIYDPRCDDSYMSDCRLSTFSSLSNSNKKRDIYQSLYWYMKVLDTDYPSKDDLMENIAKLYKDGKYVSKDINRSLFWFKKALRNTSEHNNDGKISLMNSIADIYFDNKSYEQALEWYEKAKNNEKISFFYRKGLGVDKDPLKAYLYFINNPDYSNYYQDKMMSNLLNYELKYKGDNLFLDVKVKAENGDIKSKVILAIMYILGEYTEKDVDYGRALLQETLDSIERGEALKHIESRGEDTVEYKAYLTVQKLHLPYWLSQIEKDNTKKFQLLKIAFERVPDNPYISFQLANHYYNGEGTIIDKEEAKKYYKLSCDLGFETSCKIYNKYFK